MTREAASKGRCSVGQRIVAFAGPQSSKRGTASLISGVVRYE